MRFFFPIIAIALGGLLAILPQHVRAATIPTTLTYSHEHHLFTINLRDEPQWRQPQRMWYYRGKRAVPPAELLTCGKNEVPLPEGWTSEKGVGWDDDAIVTTIQEKIGRKFERDAGTVTIRRQSGAIVFDGHGLTGRSIRLSEVATLTRAALEQGIQNIILPVTITQPNITVTDPELQKAGIREVVMIGESDFLGSPVNRRFNIGVGVRRFSGHLIPQDSVFSFDQVLGPVNAATGYRKELVIQGKKTVPDYGGGLCQVSSTAYRGPWEYGLPILQRKNHSYAVSYYGPQGTDATVYPPSADMKFLNDTPGALLIQSFVEGTKVFFIYYGTHDDRSSEVFGPFVWDFQRASKDILTVQTTDIPPGQRERISERHDGMKVLWYRRLSLPGIPATIESVFSSYETRQMAYQVGVAPEDIHTATGAALSVSPN